MIVAFLIYLCLQPPVHPDHDDARLLKTFRNEFVPLRPGENKKHPASFVYLAKTEIRMHAYSVGKYEVTQDLWRHIMGRNPSRWQGERNSVEMLSFAEAAGFCDKVTLLLRHQKLIEAHEFVRLPTEIEWEYAARAGTSTNYSFGDDAGQLTDYGWYTRNAAGNDPAVGEKKPNPWGLYDVHGYLFEWCVTSHEDKPVAYLSQADWKKQAGEQRQVLRGGSWKNSAEKLTSDFRQIEKTSMLDDAIGLRCVLVRIKQE